MALGVRPLFRLPPIWLLVFVLPLLSVGCRRATPPSFSAGQEVLALTDELEDEEEIQLYQGLQAEITKTLQQLTGTPEKPILLGTEATTDQLQHGYAIYSRYCVQCHGVNGDGNGPVAEHLDPKPRNYQQGVFKFTSTPYGSKPRVSDLALTIRRGVTGTSMPSFDRLSREDIDAVVQYVLALTHRGELQSLLAMIAYDDEELPDEEGLQEVIEEILTPWEDSANQLVMPVSTMPPMTAASVRAGHQIFLSKACNKCHGKFGRGGSMGNVEVGKDTWGNQAAAADLSSGMFHGGDRPIDIYRRIYSGINGTPMPAFNKTFSENPDAIWQLVHFIKETGNRRRLGKPPLSEADLPTTPTPEATPAAEENKPREDGPTKDDEAELTAPAAA